MDYPTHFPLTPGGATLVSCDLDEACTEVDCDAVIDEFGMVLLENSYGTEYVAHYCGLDYVEKLQGEEETEK
jgi:hypothetical protein